MAVEFFIFNLVVEPFIEIADNNYLVKKKKLHNRLNDT